MPWYAVQVRGTLEPLVTRSLELAEIPHFYPALPYRRHRFDRVTIGKRPLFPGYLFARLDHRARRFVEDLPQKPTVVSIAGKPAPIPDDTIETIRLMIASGKAIQASSSVVSLGDDVVVIDGPLKGSKGKLVKGRKNQFAIELPMLGKTAIIDIEPESLLKAA